MEYDVETGMTSRSDRASAAATGRPAHRPRRPRHAGERADVRAPSVLDLVEDEGKAETVVELVA